MASKNEKTTGRAPARGGKGAAKALGEGRGRRAAGEAAPAVAAESAATLGEARPATLTTLLLYNDHRRALRTVANDRQTLRGAGRADVAALVREVLDCLQHDKPIAEDIRRAFRALAGS
jgi:hypothetical protein